MNFLAVLTKQVVVTPAVDEVLDENGDVETPAQPAVYGTEVDGCYVEDMGDAIALNEARKEDGIETNLEFYAIKFNPQLQPMLHPVAVKSGTRVQKVREVIEVEADGETVGTTEVDV